MINADKPRLVIPIEGMESENCALIIGNALRRLNGIDQPIVEFNNRRALIYVQGNEMLKRVVKEIRNLGYEVISGKKNIPVLNMSCASCAVSVESMTKSLTGVVDARVNFASTSLLIEYLPNMVGIDDFQKAVQSIGFDLIVDDKEDTEIFEKIKQKKYALLKQRTAWSIALSLPIVIIGMFFMHMPYANFIMWALSTPVIFWIGKDFFMNAVKKAKHRSANMDTLVALSTGVAYSFSVFNTLIPDFWHHTDLHGYVYFEAPAVIITFILLGKLLEEKAKAGTSSALKNLINLQPGTATVVNDEGQQTETPIELLHKGDVILVKPGERIAVDGIVIDGYSFVDESMMTGESFPVLKTERNEVYAGTVNQKGSFRFRAEKLGKETRLASIIEIVRDAQGSKAPVQKMVDRIAGIFVPTIIAIAFFTFVAWSIFGGETGFSYGLFAFVTVLVIACPCALGLATPTAIMVGIGKGAEHGILIKDAESLEMAKNITTVVLDKTGTITEGKPVLTDIVWFDHNDSEKDILPSIEKLSEHPLAEAIINSFQNTSIIPVSDFVSITGKGVKAVVNNRVYFCGNIILLQENNVQISEEFLNKSEVWCNESKTVIWFSNEHHALSVMAVSDQIKESSIEAIRQMKASGLEVMMLTGDNNLTAQAVAEKTGIDFYQAEVLPEEKSAFVKQLQSEGKIVAMVGDGINDSAALALADVSMTPGKGSDIAMDVAKMVIISSDLNKINTAIKLSKQTVSTIHQNLWWAFLYNMIGIPIAAGLLYPITGLILNPMIAGAAMALSSVSVVSNSLRLKQKKLK